MARITTNRTPSDRWVVAIFAVAVVGLFAPGLMLPAVFTQTQTVDVPAAMLGLAGVLAALAAIAGGPVESVNPRLWVASAAFLAWAFLASLVSGRGLAAFVGEPTSMLGWWSMVAFAAIVFGVASRGRSARHLLVTAAPWLLVAQIAFVVYGVAVSGTLARGVADMVVRGTLPNSTGLGVVVVLLLPWLFVSAPEISSRMPLPARVVIAVASIAAVSIGRSRVALAVALLWAVYELLDRTSLPRRQRVTAITVVLLVAVAAGTAYVFIELGDPGGGELGMRPEFTRTAAAAIAASPVFGYGPDGFVAGGSSVSTPEFVSPTNPLVFVRGATDPHNTLLFVGVSAGLIGLTMFGWLLVETVIAWRRCSDTDPRDHGELWSVCGPFIVLLTAPANVALLPLFAFVIGVSIRSDAAEAPRQVGWTPRIFILGAMAVAAGLLAMNSLSRLPLERTGAQESPARASAAQAVSSAWSRDPYLHYLTALHWGWTAQVDEMAAMERRNLRSIERAVDVDRRDPFVALEHARVLRSYGSPSVEVEAAFAEALARWPLYPQARLEYAAYLLELGRADEASTQLLPLQGIEIGNPSLTEEIERIMESIPAE